MRAYLALECAGGKVYDSDRSGTVQDMYWPSLDPPSGDKGGLFMTNKKQGYKKDGRYYVLCRDHYEEVSEAVSYTIMDDETDYLIIVVATMLLIGSATAIR